jgi:hypothetical protein
MPVKKDHVYPLLDPHSGIVLWYAFCNGRTVPATWDNRGAALAGLATHQRRNVAKPPLHDTDWPLPLGLPGAPDVKL